MSGRGFSRYSRSIAIGSDNPDIDIDIKNLHHIDPFDEKTGITYAMYGIASAFGLDVTEIWPVAGAQGSGDAAKLQNMRARGKLPAQATEMMAHQFNTKFLPPYLQMRFDFRDDEEDQQRALIRDIRGRQRERDIGNGTLTIRAARQTMLRDGDIPRPLFREMEWHSGRLENGLPIASLFFSKEEPHATMLNLGLDNPFDFVGLERDEVMSAIAVARKRTLEAMSDTRSQTLLDELRTDYELLDWYEEQAERRFDKVAMAEIAEEPEEEESEEPDETEDEEHEGDGSSSMGIPRRPAMQKESRWSSLSSLLSRKD